MKQDLRKLLKQINDASCIQDVRDCWEGISFFVFMWEKQKAKEYEPQLIDALLDQREIILA